MDGQPLISVIVPVYNTIEYLPRCVESILAQTYRNLEILLVDDGSTDGSEKECDRFAAVDSRVRAIHKPNGGSSSARNLGLEEMKGDYVGFVDSDDYIEPDMYESLLAVLTKEAWIAQVGRDEVNPDGSLRPAICETPSELISYSERDFIKELLMHRGDCSFCTKLFAREVFLDGERVLKKFPEGALNEDFHLLLEILPFSGGVISLPKVGYHVYYRVGSNSRKKTRTEFSRVYWDSVANADFAAECVALRFPEDEELAQIVLRFGVFQRIEYLLHIPIIRMKRDGSLISKQYCSVVARLRADYAKAISNPFLTGKNKLYMTLFVISPRFVRRVHRLLRARAMKED